jgi:hypothetical protein
LGLVICWVWEGEGRGFVVAAGSWKGLGRIGRDCWEDGLVEGDSLNLEKLPFCRPLILELKGTGIAVLPN